MKILIADDSKTNLALTKLSLERLGHEVIAVSNGDDALIKFQNAPPDLVILDVVMKGLNGFETAKKIRAINTKNWIPIIFLSANVDDESIKQGIDAGGDDYLTKPFSEITMAAKIKAMQRISDMRQDLISTTQKLSLLSATDSLTGLYNRFQFDRSIVEKLSSADRHGRNIGLMFIDLDNFKLINDTFGHHIGDLLLKEVASRLQSCLRREDFIARIGGDEFCVLIDDIESLDSIGLIAQKMLALLNIDFYLDGRNIRSGASIGIAAYPFLGTTKENFLKNADVAMYHAKSLGRNNYQFFSQELNDRYKQHINLEYALKFAIERKEMFLNYLPVYNLPENKIIGFETLIGWEHPKFGAVSPNVFIPIAEETGLIIPIGNWALRTTCENAKNWSLKKYKKFKLSLNLSPHQLLQENFYEVLLDILDHNKIPPSLLEIELKETTIMGDRSNFLKNSIQKLHNIGITIAIDDFGTGYSSLTRLKHLAINTLKIDKCFIQDSISDQNSAIITNCLIALGKNLNHKVIAKGIETEKQLEFLLTKGCLYGQGFFFGKPITIEEMPNVLKKLEKDNKLLYRSI